MISKTSYKIAKKGGNNANNTVVKKYRVDIGDIGNCVSIVGYDCRFLGKGNY